MRIQVRITYRVHVAIIAVRGTATGNRLYDHNKLSKWTSQNLHATADCWCSCPVSLSTPRFGVRQQFLSATRHLRELSQRSQPYTPDGAGSSAQVSEK